MPNLSTFGLLTVGAVGAAKAALVVLLLLLDSPAAAMTWGELRNEVATIEAGRQPGETFVPRMVEIFTTVAVYTHALQQNQASPRLFCVPEGNQMSLNEAIAMVRAQALAEKAPDEVLVQEIGLRALAKRYPCS